MAAPDDVILPSAKVKSPILEPVAALRVLLIVAVPATVVLPETAVTVNLLVATERSLTTFIVSSTFTVPLPFVDTVRSEVSVRPVKLSATNALPVTVPVVCIAPEPAFRLATVVAPVAATIDAFVALA